jgi:urease accessory protein
MLLATSVIPKGHWHEAARDRIVLAYDDRYRRRVLLKTSSGAELLLNLVQPRVLQEGDALRLDDGGLIEVGAAPERLAEITCADTAALVRVAWHLGNRHLPTELVGDRLRIREDHVIIAMVKGLGAQVAIIDAPFNPEGGAYGHGAVHGHSHGHSHNHGGHDHSH